MLIKKYKNQSPLDVVLSTTDINDLFSLMVNNGKTLEELSNSNTLEAPNDQIRSISTGINVIVPVIGTYPETGYFVAKSTYLPKYTPNKTKPKQNIIDFTLTSTGDINKLYEIMILNDASINLNVFDTTLDYIVPNFEYNDSVKFINNDSVIINTGALSKQELNPLLDYNGDFNQDFNAGLPVPEPVGYSATFTFFDEGDVWGGLINTTEGTFDVIQGTTIQTFTNGYHTITIDPFQPVNINGSIYGFATTNIIKDITIRHNSFATITIENAEGYLILDSEYAANIFANNNNFTQENIDTLLIQMDNIVLLGTATIDLRSTNNIAPSETGLLAKDNLIAKGWIVYTN